MGVRFLLDTSVYSQALRGKPLLTALRRWQAAGDSQCAIAAVTAGEIEWGLHYEDNPQRWNKYEALLENRLKILQTTQAVWSVFAKMKARQRCLGEPISDLVLLIAATAKVHDLTVATLNVNDFSRIEGLVWENWSL
ncbi:MAG: type II toxin-antitoxin system VapC family toxin [Puniceicoccaceae bacterium]|nr:MAG: type II toxin-antitoxin system VapC family toxin [Puniceicoccaceae bacterium]